MKSNSSKKTNLKGKGLVFSRLFTRKGASPYDMFDYEKRDSVIKEYDGTVKFEIKDVEVPSHWSQIATDILAQKYFRKANVPESVSKTGAESSVKQIVHRLAACWKKWGEKYNYFNSKEDAEAFYDEAVFMMLGQYVAPNSPQWFNTGLNSEYGIQGKPQGHYYVEQETEELKKSESAYERPQPHACFILSVDDDLVNENGIMDLWVREARIFKYGSGVGTNFSSIRGKGETLSGGGTSSGLMSFLKIGDRAAGAIKSGGTTRRAAKMVSLDLDHPEIEDFIDWKVSEEKKAQALIEAGYPSDYEGEAYLTVSGQNSNNSIRVPNEFFQVLDRGTVWKLRGRGNNQTFKEVSASGLWDKINKAAWSCADPGLQFDGTINDWHTCPEGGRINASNPCSEYMFLDNTACNLASLNLRKFFNEETHQLDIESFSHAVRIWTVVLEISVLMAQFPSKEVAQLSYEYRTLGLGYANLGSLLMVLGLPYDSPQGRSVCAAITSILHAVSYNTSAEMAKYFGSFKRYDENKEHMLRVIRNHRRAAQGNVAECEGISILPQEIDVTYCPQYLYEASSTAWDKTLEMGEQFGFRNAQVSVIAPTGTIGMLMDCDTFGIEPEFALVKTKKLSGGGSIKMLNRAIPKALTTLGYTPRQIEHITAYISGSNTFEDAPYINKETLAVKGLTQSEIKRLEAEVGGTFDISYIFNPRVLGMDCLKRFGLSEKRFMDVNFNFLSFLGFSMEEISEANEHICGSMTIEGAPELQEEHLSVFDCANKCGVRGQRFIDPMGHIKMMAATQPFLSGAISKTVNLPNSSTVDDVARCYRKSFDLGLKAIALYRDGCKMSQPLSTKAAEKKEIVEETLTQKQVLDAAFKFADADVLFKQNLSNRIIRKTLPNRRKGYTQKVKVGGQTVYIRTGEYADGSLGEVFVDMHKEGATMRSLVNCFAIAVSIGLQYGVPLREFVDKFTFTKFEPNGPVVGHPNIKSSTSIIDFIFRMLAFEYSDRKEFAHFFEEETEKERVLPDVAKYKDESKSFEDNIQEVTPKAQEGEDIHKRVVEVIQSVQSDANFCSNCGHLMIRTGTCYTCQNCGNQGGCA